MERIIKDNENRIAEIKEFFHQCGIDFAKQSMPYDSFWEGHAVSEVKTIKLSNSTNPIACC
ncbi:MAG: hypothetical protein K2H16_06120 [Prevotella sp.]|nr:hypothetical protein [Prevotella sp.]MDE6152223.1 hypothetical protein [Prevotella sp.]